MATNKEAKAIPLRLDAERNREAILAAAAIVYADRGSETSLNDVAKLAGVGVGTVYRRFPNKESLIEALLEGKMRQYAEQTEAAAKLSETQPWAAFCDHVRTLVNMQAHDRAFSEIVSDPTSASPGFRDLHRRALRASADLVTNGQQAGVFRPDFNHRDLRILIRGNHGVVMFGKSGDVRDSTRLTDLILESLAAPVPAPE